MNATVGCTFLEFVPNERIRNIDKFDGTNLAGEMATSIELRQVPAARSLTSCREASPP